MKMALHRVYRVILWGALVSVLLFDLSILWELHLYGRPHRITFQETGRDGEAIMHIVYAPFGLTEGLECALLVAAPVGLSYLIFRKPRASMSSDQTPSAP